MTGAARSAAGHIQREFARIVVKNMGWFNRIDEEVEIACNDCDKKNCKKCRMTVSAGGRQFVVEQGVLVRPV
jgi:hypothetical protein